LQDVETKYVELRDTTPGQINNYHHLIKQLLENLLHKMYLAYTKCKCWSSECNRENKVYAIAVNAVGETQNTNVLSFQ